MNPTAKNILIFGGIAVGVWWLFIRNKQQQQQQQTTSGNPTVIPFPGPPSVIDPDSILGF